MNKVLVFIATSDGKIKRSSLEVLSHAREEAARNNMTCEALVIDENTDGYSETLHKFGISAIHTIANPIFKNHLNSPLVSALEAAVNATSANMLIMPSMEATKDV